MATGMFSISGLSGYVLAPVGAGADFTLSSPILAVAHATEQPSPESLQRLKHQYSLAAELDPARAAKLPAHARHGQLLGLDRVSHTALGLLAPVGPVHRRGLIHKSIKLANGIVEKRGRAGAPDGRPVFNSAPRLCGSLPHNRDRRKPQ